jgi:hypothetical protein
MTEPHGSEEVTQDQPQGEIEAPAVEPQGEGTDWQAMSRKWEGRAKKDAQALADMRKQIEQMVSPDAVADKDKALADAIAKAEAATVAATKYRVALAEGLPADFADRLIGSTEEELREDAERMKALFKPAGTKTDARKGQAAPAPEAKHDPNDLLRLLAKG